jgi:hypothetical protein
MANTPEAYNTVLSQTRPATIAAAEGLGSPSKKRLSATPTR